MACRMNSEPQVAYGTIRINNAYLNINTSTKYQYLKKENTVTEVQCSQHHRRRRMTAQSNVTHQR